MFVILLSPILELQHTFLPHPPKVLWTKERVANSLLSRCFHLRLTFEFIKELGSASQFVSVIKNDNVFGGFYILEFPWVRYKMEAIIWK